MHNEQSRRRHGCKKNLQVIRIQGCTFRSGSGCRSLPSKRRRYCLIRPPSMVEMPKLASKNWRGGQFRSKTDVAGCSGSAITSAPFVSRSSNFWSAAEKRYTGITEKARFYGAVPIILRPCKMMGARFAFRKPSHIIFLLRRPWRKLLIGETSPVI